MTAAAKSASTRGRFEALDGLRGIAALLVVFSHVEWPNHLTGMRFVKNGYLAVDLFFVLSGLVISTNYTTRIVDGKRFLDFIKLRLFRLYPLHVVVLIAFVGLEVLKVIGQHAFGLIPEHQPFTAGESYGMLTANVFLIQGLGWVRIPNWNFPSWSISCEFCVYILFAISALTGVARRRIFLIVISAMSMTAYAAIAFTRGTLDVRFDLGIVRCIAGFCLGLLIAGFSEEIGSVKQNDRYQIAVTIAVILVIAVVSGPMIVTVVPLWVVLIALLQSDQGPVAKVLRSRPAQFLGRVSYSIYMVHSFVVVSLLLVLKRLAPISFDPNMGRALVTINPWVGDLLVGAMVAVVLVIGSVTFRWIEEPGRMLGRKLVLSPAAPRAKVPQRETMVVGA